MRPGLLGAPHAVEVRGISRVEVACEAEQLEGRVDGWCPSGRWAAAAGCGAVVIATANEEIRLTGDS